MHLEFPCQSCNQLLKVPESSIGKKCRCPECAQIQVVPAKPVDEVFEDVEIETHCPKCNAVLLSKASLEGTKGLCKACQHIFLISFDGQAIVASDSFAFECPDCHFLFEGKPGMEGKKGKCTECKSVFEIKPKEKKQPQTASSSTRKSGQTTPVSASEPVTAKVISVEYTYIPNNTPANNVNTPSAASRPQRLRPIVLRQIGIPPFDLETTEYEIVDSNTEPPY